MFFNLKDLYITSIMYSQSTTKSLFLPETEEHDNHYTMERDSLFLPESVPLTFEISAFGSQRLHAWTGSLKKISLTTLNGSKKALII